MKRLGRPAVAWSVFATSRVRALSSASSGETSSETQPSTPSVASWIGRNRSAARLRSSTASSKNRSSTGLVLAREGADRVVVEAAVPDGLLEDRRVRRQAGHRPVGDVARQRAVGQHLAADVVEPQALAERAQRLGVRIVHEGTPGFILRVRPRPLTASAPTPTPTPSSPSAPGCASRHRRRSAHRRPPVPRCPTRRAAPGRGR